jgi:hypothetical protein
VAGAAAASGVTRPSVTKEATIFRTSPLLFTTRSANSLNVPYVMKSFTPIAEKKVCIQASIRQRGTGSNKNMTTRDHHSHKQSEKHQQAQRQHSK